MFVGKLYDVLYEETVRGKPCRERKINENRIKLLQNENENESKNENELLVIIDLNKESKAINEEEKEEKEEKIDRSNSKIPFNANENVIESDIEVEQCSDDEVCKYVRTFYREISSM